MSKTLAIILLCLLSQFCVCHVPKSSQNRPEGDILLQGITVLEAPFIYSESGPYRGYCVDVIKEISIQVGFNYTLKQSPDGQIGSVDLLNGVYGELNKQSADFAIGDISGNWLNDKKKAMNAGVVFTRPILTSSLSVLISRNLLYELTDNKTIKCLQELSDKSNASSKGQSFRCADPVTMEDIFELPQLNRLVIKGSAVHEYFTRRQPDHLSDLMMVEKPSLFGYGLEKLKNHEYVLIDESKFTEYFADQNCHFDLIDAGVHFNDEMANVKIDDSIPSKKPSPPRFINDIVIAVSSIQIELHKNIWRRDLLNEINRVIGQLERSGKLRQLQDKHWRNNCRKSEATNQASDIFAHFLSVLSCCLLLAIGNLL